MLGQRIEHCLGRQVGHRGIGCVCFGRVPISARRTGLSPFRWHGALLLCTCLGQCAPSPDAGRPLGTVAARRSIGSRRLRQGCAELRSRRPFPPTKPATAKPPCVGILPNGYVATTALLRVRRPLYCVSSCTIPFTSSSGRIAPNVVFRPHTIKAGKLPSVQHACRTGTRLRRRRSDSWHARAQSPLRRGPQPKRRPLSNRRPRD